MVVSLNIMSAAGAEYRLGGSNPARALVLHRKVDSVPDVSEGERILRLDGGRSGRKRTYLCSPGRKYIGGSAGSLEPPGPLLTHLLTSIHIHTHPYRNLYGVF